MVSTTVKRVRAIANHLNEVEDEQIEMYIEDAKVEMSDLEYKELYEEKIQRYLAAHYATIDVRRVQREKMEDMSLTFESSRLVKGKDFLETTKYGQEVIRLLEKGNVPSMVLLS